MNWKIIILISLLFSSFLWIVFSYTLGKTTYPHGLSSLPHNSNETTRFHRWGFRTWSSPRRKVACSSSRKAHMNHIPILYYDYITIFLFLFFSLCRPLFRAFIVIRVRIFVGDFTIKNFCGFINNIVEIFS